jgi:hypothetical protein
MSREMKSLFLAAAMATMLSVAVARGGAAAQERLEGGATTAADDRQETTIKLAMGPTSAPHKPGGAVDGPKDLPATCTPSSDRCPHLHRRAKRRHGHFAHG